MLAKVEKSNFQIVGYKSYNEIKFDEKPNDAVIKALKNLKMRWNPKKGVWHGFASENDLVAAVGKSNNDVSKEEATTIVTDGYLGGGAFYGSKSHLNLSGSNLTKAIRAEFKSAGIKATVRGNSASYVDSITVTVKFAKEELSTFEEFLKQFDIEKKHKVVIDGEFKDAEIYYSVDNEEQQAVIKEQTAKSIYEYKIQQMSEYGYSINQYHIENEKIFGEAAKAKLETVNDIINSYRYDESNSMVDYFDTSFYYNIYVKLI